MILEDLQKHNADHPRCDVCGSTVLIKKRKGILLCVSCGERSGGGY